MVLGSANMDTCRIMNQVTNKQDIDSSHIYSSPSNQQQANGSAYLNKNRQNTNETSNTSPLNGSFKQLINQ